LHKIIENITESPEETLEENILKSLKMQNTSMLKSATIVPGLVSSYTKSEQINLKMMRRI
jgi:CubicO group peptidase (beta-lactamase class C family)